MDTCSGCGANLFGHEWCGQCGARVEAPQAASPAPVLPRWRPPANTVAPAPAKIYSRWEAGPLSLPPAAKIAVTAGVWLAAAWFTIFSGSPVSGIVLCATAGWITRETWKRRRVR